MGIRSYLAKFNFELYDTANIRSLCVYNKLHKKGFLIMTPLAPLKRRTKL
jgi:hypothetical protein